jgi:hypothetical protein
LLNFFNKEPNPISSFRAINIKDWFSFQLGWVSSKTTFLRRPAKPVGSKTVKTTPARI